MAVRIPYQHSMFADETLGIDWTQVIGQVGGASAQVGLSWLLGGRGGGSQGSGCLQRRLTDQGQIAGCLDSLAAQYHSIAAQGNLEQTLAASTQIYQALMSDQFFGGNDAYLQQGRQVFRDAVARDRANLDASRSALGYPAQAQPNFYTDPQTGQTVMLQPSGGLDMTTVAIIGGGLLLVVLLLR